MKKGIILSAIALVSWAWAHAGCAYAHSTDGVVDTKDLGPISLNEKTRTGNEKTVFYQEGNTAVSINEDGDPNVGMKF